jgi:hypothetical protein
MSSDAVYTLVRDHLTAEWSGAPIVWPNEGLEVGDTSAPWIYAEISGTDMAAMEIGGNPVFLETGIIWMHIHCPVGTGTLEIRAIGKQLSNLFRLARLPGITFRRQSMGGGEAGDDDGLYWRQSFTIEYEYQDVLVS